MTDDDWGFISSVRVHKKFREAFEIACAICKTELAALNLADAEKKGIKTAITTTINGYFSENKESNIHDRVAKRLRLTDTTPAGKIVTAALRAAKDSFPERPFARPSDISRNREPDAAFRYGITSKTTTPKNMDEPEPKDYGFIKMEKVRGKDPLKNAFLHAKNACIRQMADLSEADQAEIVSVMNALFLTPADKKREISSWLLDNETKTDAASTILKQVLTAAIKTINASDPTNKTGRGGW